MVILFDQKQNLCTSDFIIEVNLKGYRLASVGSLHVASVATSTTVVPPLANEASLEALMSPRGCLSVI